MIDIDELFARLETVEHTHTEFLSEDYEDGFLDALRYVRVALSDAEVR